MKKWQRIGLHVLFWVAILVWRAKGDYFSKAPFEKFFWQNLLRLPIMIAATYTTIYYLLPKFILKEKRYVPFALTLGGLLFIATQIDMWLLRSDLMKWIIQPYTPKEYMWLTQLHPFRNSFLLLAIIGIASLVRFYKVYIEQEKRKNELIQENLETQYAFLKAQVNPHFLFNALNNIYSMAVQAEQREIASGLENLSGIMQYLTYESDTKLVPLEKEIELLQNYIDIEQMRFDDTDDTTISFQVTGDITDQRIAPVVLLPLVENAFKHGIKPDHKCLVSIHVNVTDKQLHFSTKNTHFEYGEKEIKTKGIGLANVRKRLDLRYPNQYCLSIQPSETYFSTKLVIDLIP
ncbi:MAG: histidine kinase [Bacteroidota bacterium]